MPDRRLQILVLIDFVVEYGGAETLATQLLSRLDPDRFDRSLVTYRDMTGDPVLAASQERTVQALRENGVRCDDLGGRTRYDLASWRPLVRRLRAGQVDVLHTHKHGPNVWGALASTLAPRTRFVAHEHSWSFEGQRARVFRDRMIARRADVVLAVSEPDRERMIRIEGLPPGQIRVLPNGIPPLAPATRSLRDELGIADDAPVVGAVGILRVEKDFAGLLQAHRHVLERRPDAQLVIVGSGPEHQALLALAEELGVAGSTHLIGYRANAAAVAGEFDVAVNCSVREGSSLAILEFMASGRPVVATDVGGSRDLLADGRAGVLVPPRDPPRLAQAILSLLEDPALAARVGTAAGAHQRSEFDIDVQVDRLSAVYEEVAARSPHRPGPRTRRPSGR